MAETAPRMPLSQDEAAALGLAVLAHVGLVAALVWLKPADAPPPPPERMEVTISDEAALVSTSPDPQAVPAPDSGPVVGDMVPSPVSEPVEVAKAEVQPRPAIVPPRLAPAPVPRQLVQPKPKPQAQAKPAQQQVKQAQRNPASPRVGTRPGNSRFDNAFGAGILGGNPAGTGKSLPAQATGQQKAKWTSSIMDRVLPRFGACVVSGLDVDKLYADIVFTLSIDGKIQSIDQVSVGGTTPSNRAQAEPMKACARKAALQGAPFLGLPPEYYDDWKMRRMRLRVRD